MNTFLRIQIKEFGMESSRRTHAFIACFICIAVFCIPAGAANEQIARSVSPGSPAAGSIVTVTMVLPPSFFGGIIETLPDGFTYIDTTHPEDATRKEGQIVIFAITGEDEITYTVKMPDNGCGYLNGKWENVGTGEKGTIPATLLSTPGADTSSCTGTQQSPGFGLFCALCALSAIFGYTYVGWKR